MCDTSAAASKQHIRSSVHEAYIKPHSCGERVTKITSVEEEEIVPTLISAEKGGCMSSKAQQRVVRLDELRSFHLHLG